MPKSLVQQQFGANAANYAASPVHAAGASLSRLIELVRPQKHWRALDIATGAGHTAAAFAPYVASVIASDFTEEMLAEAKKLAAAKGLANLEIATADAEQLPFEDASFDLVTCRIAPHHFSDVPAFLAETWRVLKPGGTFALVDNVAPDAATTPGFSKAELRTAAVTFNAFEKIRDPSHARALTTEEWRDLVAETGFRIEHEEVLPKPMKFSDWCKNTSVPAGTVPKLETMLHDAAPCLRAFLQPQPANGDIGFILRELVLIGSKQ